MFRNRSSKSEPEQIAGELEGAAGVLDGLDGFDAGKFVEEPAAAGEHEQGMALKFEQSEAGHPGLLADRTAGMLGEEGLQIVIRTVQDHADVGVADGPGIVEVGSGLGLVFRGELVAEPVESFAQGLAPVLVPAGSAAAVAAAVAAPAIDSMRAAPGARCVQFDLHRGRV